MAREFNPGDDLVQGVLAQQKRTLTLGEALKSVRKQMMMRMRMIELAGTFEVKHNTRPNFWFTSDPGIGKTASIQALEEPATITYEDGSTMNWPGCEVKSIDCATLVPGSLSGVLAVVKDKEGISKAVRLHVENLLPRKPETESEAKDPNFPYNKPGILFLDEITSLHYEARSELLTILCGTILREKDDNQKIIPPALPPNWIVIAAGNRSDQVSKSNGDWAANVRARFNQIDLVADFYSWKQWANTVVQEVYHKVGVHPYVMSFLEENPQYFMIPLTSEMIKMESIVPNPRNWAAVSDYCYGIDEMLESGWYELGTDDVETVYGDVIDKVGEFVARKFFTFLKFKESMVPLKDLLTVDFSKNEAKYKKYIGTDKAAKLMSVYSAINAAASDPKVRGAEGAEQKMYSTLLNNADWLISSTAGSSRDLLASLVTRVKSVTKNFKVNNLNDNLKSAFLASTNFRD